MIFLLNLDALVLQLLQMDLLVENQIGDMKYDVVERCLCMGSVLSTDVFFDVLNEVSDLGDLSSRLIECWNM
jgi:hypothetical protein